MTMQNSLSASDSVVESYITAMLHAFGHESWTDIEPYGERIWRTCCKDDGPPWLEVKDAIQARWPR